MSDNQEEFPFAACDFYLEEMRRAIAMWEAGEMTNLAHPIFSFFYGARTDSPVVEIQTGHANIFLEDEMHARLTADLTLFPRWVEIVYTYFWRMAAAPELARDIWITLWLTLRVFETVGVDTMPARYQMAAWAASYDPKFRLIALNYIKSSKPLTALATARRALFLSTKINEGEHDFLGNVIEAYALSRHLPSIQRLQAHIHYYCKVSPSRDVLTDILSILNWTEMFEYRKEKMDLLAPVYWTLVHENKYDDLLFFIRCLKNTVDISGFNATHAFLLPSDGARFTAITKSDLVTFEDQDNGQSYYALVKLVNRMNKIAISLLGDEEVDYRIDEERFGTPSLEEDFEVLRRAVITHYHLDDSFYQELGLMSPLPSHNHPVQGALCSLGVPPPYISVSLQNLADEPAERAFIFFLSSSTYTHDMEAAWIRREFGASAEIHTDPSCEFFVEALNTERYTHVYISAHGIYNHWEDDEDAIHFSEESRVRASLLQAIKRTGSSRRTIVLNICDGAASPLSYNPNNRGLAASLAAGNQVVISHIWPVQPLYAAIFGVLVVSELTAKSAPEAVLSVCEILSLENSLAAARIKDKGASFEDVAAALASATFPVSDFRNLGSVTIYA